MICCFLPPCSKGGRGDFFYHLEIPLNPPFSKGDFLYYRSLQTVTGAEFRNQVLGACLYRRLSFTAHAGFRACLNFQTR
jgi:hypothetical protein